MKRVEILIKDKMTIRYLARDNIKLVFCFLII